MPDPPPDDKLPPLHIDVPAADADDLGEPWESGEKAPVKWSRVGKIAGLVVAVAAATTLVVDERHDTAAEAAEESVVNLMLGISGNGSPAQDDEDVVSFTAQMYNAGPRDVRLHAWRPSEWSEIAELREAKKLEAGAWTPVTLEVAPDCDHGTISRTVEATVQTEAGIRTVLLDVPPDDVDNLRWHLQSGCSTDEAEIFVEISTAVATEPQDDALRMAIGLTFFNTGTRSVDIRGVTTSTDGLGVEALNLPHKVLGHDDQSSPWTVDFEWRITDCTTALDFVDVRIAVTGADGDSISSGQPELILPASGAVALTRFVMEQCS